MSIIIDENFENDNLLENSDKDLSLINVINNRNNHRFEIRMNILVAKVPYKLKENLIELLHTEVPEEWRGLGIATKLSVYALNYAKNNNLMILPTCPFIRKYIMRHPEWNQYII
jgi:predicted GNAT family acetyltransferase